MKERLEDSETSFRKKASLFPSCRHPSFFPPSLASSTTAVEFLWGGHCLATGDTETTPSLCSPLGAHGQVPSSFSKCVS